MGYLESLERFGINLGLERITHLLKTLGNPQTKFKSIHIAGTNGKGSTAAMIASILKEAGYRVGLYTSPHLFDYTERIKINGKDISMVDFHTGLKLVQKKASKLKNKPTVFEALTAVAFWYFAKKKVDFAIVEVGLGGRLDATNVLTPLVSIITNIDYEHTKILGKTLAKIAGEKAAIIKAGVPVVTAEEKPEPLKVIKSVCEKNHNLLISVNRKQELGNRKQEIGNSNLLGKHQIINAACADVAVRLAGIKVSRSAIKKGFQKAKWPGRFQIISKKPYMIVDGAHNPAGIKALNVTIQELFSKKFTIIFGCQKDKDYRKMLKELKPIASRIIVTKSSHKQAAKLKGYVSIEEAFAKWDKKSPLLITGSLFLVADALKILDVKL